MSRAMPLSNRMVWLLPSGKLHEQCDGWAPTLSRAIARYLRSSEQQVLATVSSSFRTEADAYFHRVWYEGEVWISASLAGRTRARAICSHKIDAGIEDDDGEYDGEPQDDGEDDGAEDDGVAVNDIADSDDDWGGWPSRIAKAEHEDAKVEVLSESSPEEVKLEAAECECMPACSCACACACMCMCLSLCTYLSMHVHARVCMHVLVLVHACVCTCMLHAVCAHRAISLLNYKGLRSITSAHADCTDSESGDCDRMRFSGKSTSSSDVSSTVVATLPALGTPRSLRVRGSSRDAI